MLRKKLKLNESSEQNEDTSSDVQDSINQAHALSITFEMLFWEKIWKLETDLARELMEINYKASDKNIAAIYNPLDYAADLHCNYLKKFLKKSPEILFLGKLSFSKAFN
jgi:hypothetical protein